MSESCKVCLGIGSLCSECAKEYHPRQKHPVMEHNGPANIIHIISDIREGRRAFGPDVLDAIERQAVLTTEYMSAWSETPGIAWHDVIAKYDGKTIIPKG